MSIFKLNERTKRNISACVGVPFEELMDLSLDEEVALAEKMRGGEKIVFSRERRGDRVGRGSPLLVKKKIRTMDDVNKKIDKITRVRVK